MSVWCFPQLCEEDQPPTRRQGNRVGKKGCDGESTRPQVSCLILGVDDTAILTG
jgi:hypothetical protein